MEVRWMIVGCSRLRTRLGHTLLDLWLGGGGGGRRLTVFFILCRHEGSRFRQQQLQGGWTNQYLPSG